MLKTKGSIKIVLVLVVVLMIGSISFACGTKSTAVPPLQQSSPPTAPSQQPLPVPQAPANSTKIQFLAHACFLITSSSGVIIITDPYTANNTFNYSPVNEAADIVTVSHEHADHNNVAAVKGQPEVLRGVGVKNVEGIEFKGVASYHDDSSGKQRGANTILCFSIDGVKFCHLGDLGHRLSAEQMAEIGQVDVLFIPVGGGPTIDAKTATDVCSDLKPKIILPMHYKTPKVSFTLAGVDDFLASKINVKRLNTSVLELKQDSLPAAAEVILLELAK